MLRFGRVPPHRLVHPTEKPVALMRHLVSRLVPEGGVVLDPFGGSGSTGVAAVLDGRSCILIEKSVEYAGIAKHRVDAAFAGTDWKNHRQPSLFGAE